MPDDLIIDERLVIPGDEFEISFVRSSGPGGQNVNKVNTKVVLRWSPRNSAALPEDLRARFLARYRRRLTVSGELVLTSQRHRRQSRNVSDSREKLRDLILAVATPPTPRKRGKPKRGAVERRLQDKRERSERKQRRSFRADD